MRQLGITRIDDGDRLVGGLSGGERQALAIARAVHFGASVLILDEPTAALGVKEAAHVLRIVLQARRKGIAVIFITHNVVHALTVGDHFAVLISGAKAADFRKGEKSREEITDLMAGGEHMAELEAEIESYMATHDGACAAGASHARPVKTLLSRASSWRPADRVRRPLFDQPKTDCRATMAKWIDACATDDIEEEDVIRFDHDGRTFAIYRSPDDAFFCTDGPVHA